MNVFFSLEICNFLFTPTSNFLCCKMFHRRFFRSWCGNAFINELTKVHTVQNFTRNIRDLPNVFLSRISLFPVLSPYSFCVFHINRVSHSWWWYLSSRKMSYKTFMPHIYWWLSARLQYLHCYGTGHTAVLHWAINIWARSRNCGCLVTWFCYQLIAKPGNKTAAVPWPDPYVNLSELGRRGPDAGGIGPLPAQFSYFGVFHKDAFSLRK